MESACQVGALAKAGGRRTEVMTSEVRDPGREHVSLAGHGGPADAPNEPLFHASALAQNLTGLTSRVLQRFGVRGQRLTTEVLG